MANSDEIKNPECLGGEIYKINEHNVGTQLFAKHLPEVVGQALKLECRYSYFMHGKLYL